MMKNQQFPLGGFTLSRNFHLSKHVDFMRVNKIGAINGKPRGYVKVEPCSTQFYVYARAAFHTLLYFICARKILRTYAREIYATGKSKLKEIVLS